ncbi:MAG TPA: hypothetical protein VFS97_15220 [Nitrososphaeraceae archaeon]|nr:hypothetical protein [Nitrososphaeraceae archaeon]
MPAMTKTKLLPVLFIVSAVILVSGAMQSSAMAYPYSQHNKNREGILIMTK